METEESDSLTSGYMKTYNNQGSVTLTMKDIQINRTGWKAQRYTHTYCHLSSDNLASIYSGERSLFNKWCAEHKTVTCKIVKSDHCPIACCCSSSLTQSCPTLWDPMDCSTPGVPDLHQLPEPAQTHVHWASDAIQPSCPLSSSSSALNLSLNQGLF